MKKIGRHQLDNSMWKGASPTIFAYAKKLREKMTEAEWLLWQKLKNNQFYGYKFRRQHPLLKYIADFYCHQLKLIIEIDGSYHEEKEQSEYDIERTAEIVFNDISVIRFTNEEIENEMENVLIKLKNYIDKRINKE